MKMFKKLMAVAVAGVMALTVLTGCAGNVVNKKDIVNTMNDVIKYADLGVDVTVEQGSDKLAKDVLAKTAAYAKDHMHKMNWEGEVLTAEEAAVYALWDAEYDEDDDAGIRDAVLPKDTKDQYTLMYTALDEYESKAFKDNQSLVVLVKAMMMNRSVRLNNVEAKAKTITASIATQKIGDTTFLVIVTVQAEK